MPATANPPAVGSQELKWPEMPYKGFSYYGPTDVPLFAGRESQVTEFARMVAQPGSRFVLLQGATGCGKSSFLRAGLIPFLEGRQRGFEFRKGEDQGPNSKAVFIRSTDTPLQKLAEEIFKVAAEGYLFFSPVGEERVDLHDALFEKNEMDDFVRLIIDQPEKLVESLRIIAVALPVTLVLVIDQGEEVLSLSGGQEVQDAQAKYFRFLAEFGTSNFPLKLIVALRTDYFGLFLDAINSQSPGQMDIVFYRLKNLGPKELIRAIKRPTQPEALLNYGPPEYGFDFEEGLPEIIVEDLKRTAEAGGLVGGELPVLQVVCETLFRKTRMRKKPWKITREDYRGLGDIETQLNDYVDLVLVSFCNLQKIPTEKNANEILHWKDALAELAVIQANNSVTTALRTVDDLTKVAEESVRYFRELLEYLALDDQGVLREEKIRKLGEKTETSCYSLRHDAVGLVLVRWKAARRASRGVEQSYYFVMSMGVWVYVFIGIVASAVGAVQAVQEHAIQKDSIVFLLTGTIVIAFALVIRKQVLRRGRVFAGFRFQLMSVLIPTFKYFMPGKMLDRDSIKALEQNPVFRLYWRTTPSVDVLWQRVRARLKM